MQMFDRLKVDFMKTIKGICIITKDVPGLRTFYNQILQADFDGDGTFSTFTSVGAQLSICDEKIMEEMAPGSLIVTCPGRYTLEIKVDDVDIEYQRLLEIKTLILKAPTTQPWGLRSVWCRDPDGNIVNLFSNVGVDVV
jgi:predicted enzyme related to lactoylglutathione lyase